MACCHQTASHYLSQCWPWSMSPYSITRPQWVNRYSVNIGVHSLTIEAVCFTPHTASGLKGNLLHGQHTYSSCSGTSSPNPSWAGKGISQNPDIFSLTVTTLKYHNTYVLTLFGLSLGASFYIHTYINSRVLCWNCDKSSVKMPDHSRELNQYKDAILPV